MSKEEKDIDVKEETDVTTEENVDKVVDKIEKNANNIEDTKEVVEDTNSSEDKLEEKETAKDNETVEKEDPHKVMKEELKAEITKELRKELDGSNGDEKQEVAKTGFLESLSVSFVDLVVSAGVALALYMLTQVILKLVDYRIVDTFGIYLIVYLITNLLYKPICELTKNKQTIGERLLNRK